jgi:uncharacterized protein YciI
MRYVIFGKDAPDSLARRAAARPRHLEYLRELQREGRLLLAGPRPKIDATEPGAAGFHGSLIVAEFADLQAARDWADHDPYREAGVFEQVEVFPFVKVLPA